MSKQARDKHSFNSMRGGRAGGQRRLTQETVSGTFVILSHHQCRDVVMFLKSKGADFLGPLSYSKNLFDFTLQMPENWRGLAPPKLLK